jgi:hypothetical protein
MASRTKCIPLVSVRALPARLSCTGTSCKLQVRCGWSAQAVQLFTSARLHVKITNIWSGASLPLLVRAHLWPLLTLPVGPLCCCVGIDAPAPWLDSLSNCLRFVFSPWFASPLLRCPSSLLVIKCVATRKSAGGRHYRVRPSCCALSYTFFGSREFQYNSFCRGKHRGGWPRSRESRVSKRICGSQTTKNNLALPEMLRLSSQPSNVGVFRLGCFQLIAQTAKHVAKRQNWVQVGLVDWAPARILNSEKVPLFMNSAKIVQSIC